MPGGFDEERAAIAAGIHRSQRVCADNGDRTARNGFQVTTRSGDGAAGSDGGDEMGHQPCSVRPDFRAGRVPMGLRVGRIVILIGKPGTVDLRGQPLGDF